MSEDSHGIARRARSEGFVVVAVLWILAALATLATIYAVYVVNTAIALTVHDERLQAEGLVTAGIELTAYQISANRESWPARGKFAFRMGDAAVTVEFFSESGRIDINVATKELLAGLFTGLGAPRGAAEGYAERIIAWRTPPSTANEDEASNYRSAGLRYVPRGGPFPHVNELYLVRGVPQALLERALPFLTVYSGQPTVNIFAAAPEVLAALPGMSPEMLFQVLAQRERAPQNAAGMTALIGLAQPLISTQATKATRVNVRIDLANGRQMRSEVVIFLLDSGVTPYRVLSWRDDVEEPPVERTRTR
jgi:general secretion pathway protein K